jgi:DNA-binding NarL/FixJ family response regulator
LVRPTNPEGGSALRLHAEQTAVIADPYPLWRDALATLLGHLEMKVVGRASSAEEAAALVDEHHPDLLVTDYALATTNGTNLLQLARDVRDDVRCVVLSEDSDVEEREAAFAAGAWAYCAKQAEPDDLAAAIRQVYEPSIYFADALPRAPKITHSSIAEASALTKREIEILRLTAEGHSNSELARMLWVTEQTVKFHLSNIYRKLNVANRTEASRWALVHGLLETTPAAEAV